LFVSSLYGENVRLYRVDTYTHSRLSGHGETDLKRDYGETIDLDQHGGNTGRYTK